MIGYAIIDIAELEKARLRFAKWHTENWSNYFYHHQGEGAFKTASDPFPDKESFVFSRDELNMKDREWARLIDLLQHLKAVGQKPEVFYADEKCTIVGYNNKSFLIPSELVEVKPLKDYEDSSLGTLGAISDNLAQLPVNSSSLSLKTVKSSVNDLERSLNDLQEEEQRVKRGESEALAQIKAELDRVQAEMEKRQKELMEALAQKKEELEAKKAEYKKQLFLLETQIYGIRCYLGEVVSFHTIRDGHPAQTDEPIVIYQKIRYLDEELGRYLSLFGFGNYEGDHNLFLEALKARDDIADLLAPGPKSISVIKLSRTGTVKGSHDVFDNMLKDYEMYHENQLAILIRNGEQLHITWLEADKINLSDENLFYDPSGKSREVEQDDKNNGVRNTTKEEYISRYFFFAVLQGVLDNTDLISIPEKVSVTSGHSKYLVFSLAQGWLKDTRYGSFADMISRSKDLRYKEGDYILTGTRIHANYSRDNAWDNDRGIGDKNRTRGLALPGKEILKVNKVLPYITVKSLIGTYKATPKSEEDYSRIIATSQKVSEREQTNKMSPDYWYNYAKNVSQITEKVAEGAVTCYSSEGYYETTDNLGIRCHYSVSNKRDYDNAVKAGHIPVIDRIEKIISYEPCEEAATYCSVQQDGTHYDRYGFRETTWYVNLRFYSDEVIPLNFLCSTWIKAVIQSGDIGNYRLCGAAMNFSDMLPYLHKILAFAQKREDTEKQMLINAGGEEFIKANSDWDAQVCEWRIAKGYHELTATRAGRFLKEKGA